MTDPRAIVRQAREGPVPANWRVFTKRRGKVSGFLHRTSHDPDPLLVITPDAVIEYVDEHKPVTVVEFGELSEIDLRMTGQSFSDSSRVSLSVWLDLRFRDGGSRGWRSVSFADDLHVIQGFIEAYGAHKAARGR
ncbi:hypothetical protein [Streptomyces sp. NPDC013455]|uniref:hypothetical protein n=1 Tax=Streptomyces sp. NPDC013455 TaxID=3155605 RepID=UPI0033CD079F